MDKYETEILLLLNENEEKQNTGIIVLEFQIPEMVGPLDRAKYSALLVSTNKLLSKNNAEIEAPDIVNVILDALKIGVAYAAKMSAVITGTSVIPNSMKAKVLLKKFDGSPLPLTLNPLQFILDFVVSQLFSKLYEIAVSPVRVKYLVKSYKEMISRLEQIKRVCKDEETIFKCNELITQINKAIKELERKVYKEDSNMFTLKEMMDNMEYEESQKTIYTESDMMESLEEAEVMCLGEEDLLDEEFGDDYDYYSEGCKKEACGSKGCKKEATDSEDMEDDVDFEESCLFFDVDEDF